MTVIIYVTYVENNAVWYTETTPQIHKVTASIMPFLNSHCGPNFTAEHGNTIKGEKKNNENTTHSHIHTLTSHTRVLHGELSWEGRQFHLREL